MAKRFFPPAWLKGGGRFAPSGQSSNGSSWALQRGTTVLVAVALFALVSVGLLSYYQARDLSATASAIHHTQEVLTQISVVRARLDEIPAASRGYALTGQPRFVQAFAANIAGIDSQLDRLQALTHGNAAQQERIELLRRLAKERIEVGRKVFDTRRLGGLADAAEMVSDDPGEKITVAIRRTLQGMEKAEHALLAERERASLAAHQGTFLLLPAGTLLSLMVLAAGVFRLNQEAVAVKNAHEKATMELLESISDGFFALDVDWRFVRGNSAAFQMLGKAREEVLGQVIWEVFPEMRDLAYELQFRKAKRENVTVRFEEADPNPGEDWFEIRAYPTHWGMNVFFNDITKRKQTEARLRQLSRAVEQSPSIVMITDTTGRIEYVNPKFTEITGYEMEEVLGKNPRILRGPESIPRQGQELWEAIRAGHEWRGEFHNQKKSGEIYWEYASISPITDEHGRTTHFVAVKEDITRRKMMETSLVEAKREAEEASRAKDVFLAMLSHELRTPLAPVLLMASVSEADESLTPEVREQFQMIRNSIELEARLIDDLLDLTKVTRGKFLLKFKPFSAEEPLEKTLEMLRQDYEAKNLTLEWERSAAASMVCADAARLHQVFWNLLKNAIKFTPAGGAIKIRTFNPDPATLAVEVRDTGVGIAREFLDQVFQPFQQGAATGKMQFGGLGLGLAITKAIVEMHGGTIHVDSPGVGLGSIFTVQIPLSNGEGASVPGVASPEPLGSVPLRILLVEDDKATRTVLSRLLSKDGHHVVTAGSCAEAFKALRAQPEALPFERLLCDLGLPDGSGLDIVGPVKERSPGIRAIAISGFGMAEDVRRSREAGFDAHLVKPLNVEALRSTLFRAA